MEVKPADLQLVLLPGKNAPLSYAYLYQRSYDCWREVWIDALEREHKIEAPLFSDEFTRQDEILALFYQGECAGLCFLKWVDFAEDTVKHDSYFKFWPELTLHKLCLQGKIILVCSQFTLHFKFRKNQLGLCWKDLLVALTVERFIHSNCDAMTGTMRLQKNMGQATYRSGATPLLQNLDYGHGQSVDLVAFYQGKVFDSVVPGIAPLVHAVFPQVIALVNPIHRYKEIKHAA